MAGHLLSLPAWRPVAAGTYEIEFLGSDGQLKHTATVTVAIEPEGPPRMPIPDELRTRLIELQLLPAE